MECKKVRERLITGYVDKELGPEENAGVEGHLAVCPDCLEFFEAVQKSAVTPFKAPVEMQPDSIVWQRIREKIEAEGARSGNWFGTLADSLAPFLRMPQPVFRVAFATALILAVIVVAEWPSGYVHPAYAYVEEQMAFMEELGSGNTDPLNGDLKDYDEAFEEVGGRNETFRKCVRSKPIEKRRV